MTIYNHFRPEDNVEAIQFRQDKVLQSAELNAVQSAAQARLQGIADALLKNGDVIRDARIVVNADTGATVAQAGAIYLQGAVRGVPPAALSIPVVGVVNVGIYLRSSVVTELEDPSLLNPAVGSPAHQQPGAQRLVVAPVWGYAGDGQPGDFFPVWTVEDGYVRSKEPPPNLDAITQALARYDVDSAGGTYIVEGLAVDMAADLPTGEQVYTVAEGRARVAGYGHTLQTSRRLVTAAVADLLTVDSEPHLSATDGAQRIDLGRPPCKGMPVVRITARRTVQIVHGGFSGAADPLPDPSVVQLESVKQAGNAFAKDADYKLTGGQVDWSPNGAEPAPGSTYEATYLYIKNAAPTAADARGFTVSGAIAGTMVLVTYEQQLRRIDRLCLTRDGAFVWVRGIASAWTPTAPVVPDDMLALASVYQTWDSDRRVVADGVKTVPMQQLAGERRRVDGIILDLAELRLATSAQGLDSGVKKGLFADPFLSDAQRDAGLPQTAAIVHGSLQLPITSTVHQLGRNISDRIAPAHTYRIVLSQTLRTGSMQVNPYMAFDPIPAAVALTPNVDRWTDVSTVWKSAVTERLYAGSGSVSTLAGASTATRVLSEESRPLETLRSITVRFDIAGFGPGEPLGAVTFDGIPVVAQPLAGGALIASSQGALAGTFAIPAGVPAGTKAVLFSGTLGSKGSQTFMGQGTAMLRTQQSVTTETWALSNPVPAVVTGGAVFGPSGAGSTPVQNSSKCSKWLYDGYFDPLAQTFVWDETGQCCGAKLWFTAKSGPVVVQVRETSNGVPTQAVVAEQRVAPEAIALGGAETVIAWTPVVLQGRREYALVVLCDDAITAVSVAELGKQDPVAGYVTSQPYQVGVLLSSSNASTWTPHQDRDLAFALLAPRYTETERVIDLGTADVVDATDLMVLGFAERPSAAANLTFDVEFPASMQSEVVRLTDGQVVWLAAPFTGQLKVRARITGDVSAAAVLGPGVQLIAGHIEPTGTYITRTVNATGATRVKMVYEGDIPGGASVQVHAQTTAANAPWVAVPYVSAASNAAGVREITHELAGLANATGLRVRLTLTGGTTARPFVRNLRGAVL
ncbi:DUF4815 domain-containing protein [Acidovorax sp. SUPP1855]|uniref:DUF4815 domain-containing protein n=1 Tax=Acidovorax sp. SUPP1855 TaxID=431774 RepID=UPI0023DE67B9|nr:DUF4815 domain-containing protein [Acidovorax sp. SUPP1855]GKS83218.1 DUF4815 domain-containing protein [Acidovorax sp. SUPP1855]